LRAAGEEEIRCKGGGIELPQPLRHVDRGVVRDARVAPGEKPQRDESEREREPACRRRAAEAKAERLVGRQMAQPDEQREASRGLFLEQRRLYCAPMIKAVRSRQPACDDPAAAKAARPAALELARRVLAIEADAISALAARLDEHFLSALSLILERKGRVLVTGIGKSGHIARKIASTLSSTGPPAYFMHPAEASH